MNVKGGEWKERVNASSTNVISRVEREIQFVCAFASRTSFVVGRLMQRRSARNDNIKREVIVS